MMMVSPYILKPTIFIIFSIIIMLKKQQLKNSSTKIICVDGFLMKLLLFTVWKWQQNLVQVLQPVSSGFSFGYVLFGHGVYFPPHIE